MPAVRQRQRAAAAPGFEPRRTERSEVRHRVRIPKDSLRSSFDVREPAVRSLPSCPFVDHWEAAVRAVTLLRNVFWGRDRIGIQGHVAQSGQSVGLLSASREDIRWPWVRIPSCPLFCERQRAAAAPEFEARKSQPGTAERREAARPGPSSSGSNSERLAPLVFRRSRTCGSLTPIVLVRRPPGSR